MKSFGFWLESEDKPDIEPLSIDVLLNFNLWCEPSSGAGRDLDFGFKLSRAVDSEDAGGHGSYSLPKHVDAFVLYCPFSLDKKQVFDLYDVLISSQSRVLGAVFNEKCKVTSSDSKPYASVEFPGGSNDSFTLCKIANSISIEDTPDDVPGCFIRIALPGTLPDGALYFRFRIKGPGISSLVQKYDSKDSPFNSAFSRVEIVDFRFNDYRTLPDCANNHVEAKHSSFRLNTMQAHFLLMADSGVDVDSGVTLKEKRLLEDGLWDDYLKVGHSASESKRFGRHRAASDFSNLVAWHWKKGDLAPVDGYRMYLKLRIHVCNFITLVKYLFYLFVITVSFDVAEKPVVDFLSMLVSFVVRLFGGDCR